MKAVDAILMAAAEGVDVNSSAPLLLFLTSEAERARALEEGSPDNAKAMFDEELQTINDGVLKGEMLQSGTAGTGLVAFDNTPATTRFEELFKTIKETDLDPSIVADHVNESSMKGWGDVDTNSDLVVFRYETPDDMIEHHVDKEKLVSLMEMAKSSLGALPEITSTLRAEGAQWEPGPEFDNCAMIISDVRGRWAACLSTEDLLKDVLSKLAVVELNPAENPAWSTAASSSTIPGKMLPIVRGNEDRVVIQREELDAINEWASQLPGWAEFDETPLTVRDAVREDVYTKELGGS